MLGSTPRNRRQPNHRLLKTTNTVILLIDFLSLTTLLHAHLQKLLLLLPRKQLFWNGSDAC